jgi:hypothetical protein
MATSYSYESPEEVAWEWFDREVKQRSFPGWIARIPIDGRIPDALKEYPPSRCEYYRIKGRGDVWAASTGNDVLICESDTLRGVQVQRYSPPEK